MLDTTRQSARQPGTGREQGVAGLYQEPSVATLLAVDAEYRDRAAAGALRSITMRGPGGTSVVRVPVFEGRRDRHFIVAHRDPGRRAHLRDRADPVSLFVYDNHREHTCLVYTAQRGPLRGKRVVRGREAECAAHHAAQSGG